MSAVTFTVYGTPQPKGSTRAFAKKRRDGQAFAVTTSDNPSASAWAQTIREQAQQHAGDQFFDDAVAVTLTFGLIRPPSVSRRKRPYPVVKPDADKLARCALDALTGVLFRDDAQVVQLSSRKRYVEYGPAHVEIRVEAWEGHPEAVHVPGTESLPL